MTFTKDGPVKTDIPPVDVPIFKALFKEKDEVVEQFVRYLQYVRRCSPLTIVAYRSDIVEFIHWLKLAPQLQNTKVLDQTLLITYIDTLRRLSGNTIRRRIHALSAWFQFLIRQGQLQQNPAQGLPLPRRQRRHPKYPTIIDVEHLINVAITPLEQVIVVLLAGTGLRRAELINLDLASLALDTLELRVIGKGDRERFIPLPAGIHDIIQMYLSMRGMSPGPLLLNRSGKRLGITSLQRIFQRLIKRAGLVDAGYTLHSMRHAYATMLVRAGVDLGTIRDLLGHSDIAITSVYLHSDLRSKRAAVEQLPILGMGGNNNA